MYCTSAQIAALIKPCQLGVGNTPAAAAVEEMIERKGEVIDGYCRDRYTVPFSPVPQAVEDLCIALVLGSLVPIIYGRDSKAAEDARAEAKEAVRRLEAIQATKFSLQAEDHASQGMGGQIYYTAPTEDRIFDIEQEY